MQTATCNVLFQKKKNYGLFDLPVLVFKSEIFGVIVV